MRLTVTMNAYAHIHVRLHGNYQICKNLVHVQRGQEAELEEGGAAAQVGARGQVNGQRCSSEAVPARRQICRHAQAHAQPPDWGMR